MIQVLRTTWPLLLGMMLLMVGNGVQGTLLGIRGAEAGFSTFAMSVVMSAYFLGFLGGSRLAPELIRRVGHVRVFAALGSLISAVLVMYPALTEPWAWTLGRVIIGFCFSGVYVTAESWLNNAVTNEIRGKALSLYMIVQMAGIVCAQGLLILDDPTGFVLFIIPSVLVSIAFAPILLSVNPTPAFDNTKPMKLSKLWETSPLGCVGMIALGGVFSALFGMAAVYGTLQGMNVPQIALFMAVIYTGGLVLQYPIGWLSDRMDRRMLITVVALVAALACLVPLVGSYNYSVLLVVAFLVGGCSNPLYSLFIAYTNDFLEYEDMAAASGGLIFINGLGAIAGPLVVGWIMGLVGPSGFFLFLSLICFGLVVYAVYRMTQRAAPSVDETGSYAPVSASASVVAVEVAQEYYIDTAQEEEEAAAAEAAG
ncbi:MFS transporter [Alphaproteobacteria bacterium KMM 3653]|uniref:MFS transporter n=1 Tax=Harenicola maris TaxID=2841044 RepID=A0AAP2CL43_9RHOB|nr:MFS transporter [Harenicola maris]